MKIILATNNLHKRDELLAVLRNALDKSVELLTLDEAGLAGLEIEETGTTLEENALIKARAVHDLTGSPTLADDTGLAVSALGGAPGVYSARYAGENVSYSENVTKLLNAMQESDDRQAEFRTVLAFIDESATEHLFSGSIAGSIAFSPRGTNGFGYDSVFEPREGAGKAFAEMTAEEKNRMSHRARALRIFTEFLARR